MRTRCWRATRNSGARVHEAPQPTDAHDSACLSADGSRRGDARALRAGAGRAASALDRRAADGLSRIGGPRRSGGPPSQALVLEGIQLRARRDFPAVLEKLADALTIGRRTRQPTADRLTLREQRVETSRNLDLPDAPKSAQSSPARGSTTRCCSRTTR